MNVPKGCLDCVHRDRDSCLILKKHAKKANEELYDNRLGYCSKKEAIFPYSEEMKHLQKECRYSGEGTIWCYPINRNGTVCKTCSINPDLEEGLSIYSKELRRETK